MVHCVHVTHQMLCQLSPNLVAYMYNLGLWVWTFTLTLL